MSEYVLSFCKVNILREDVAELIVDDGVEVTVEMIKEGHYFLIQNMAPSFSILINRLNSYTYSYEAKLEASTVKEITSVAILSNHSNLSLSLKSMALMFMGFNWDIKVFNNREPAIEWLYSKAVV